MGFIDKGFVGEVAKSLKYLDNETLMIYGVSVRIEDEVINGKSIGFSFYYDTCVDIEFVIENGTLKRFRDELYPAIIDNRDIISDYLSDEKVISNVFEKIYTERLGM